MESQLYLKSIVTSVIKAPPPNASDQGSETEAYVTQI